jgi:hypothetical protein
MYRSFIAVSVAGALAFAVPALADDVPSAQAQCRTERKEMGKEAFRLLYGTNAKGTNAFGKCVSKRAKATAAAQQAAQQNAAKACKAERAADPAAFRAKYGTGENGANAFGKCVSQKARAKAAARTKAQVRTEVNAAKACKAERAADKDAFAAKYGAKRNAFGKCVAQKARTKSK